MFAVPSRVRARASGAPLCGACECSTRVSLPSGISLVAQASLLAHTQHVRVRRQPARVTVARACGDSLRVDWRVYTLLNSSDTIVASVRTQHRRVPPTLHAGSHRHRHCARGCVYACVVRADARFRVGLVAGDGMGIFACNDGELLACGHADSFACEHASRGLFACEHAGR